MRLVDIDNLELQEYEPQNDLAYAAGWNDCVDTIKDDISDIPTIEAIPVEWLKEHDNEDIRDIDGNSYGRRRITVVEALSKWQKEQEAQDAGAQTTQN